MHFSLFSAAGTFIIYLGFGAFPPCLLPDDWKRQSVERALVRTSRALTALRHVSNCGFTPEQQLKSY